jgi:hypothetical protein
MRLIYGTTAAEGKAKLARVVKVLMLDSDLFNQSLFSSEFFPMQSTNNIASDHFWVDLPLFRGIELKS